MPIDWSKASPLSLSSAELERISRIHPELQKLRKNPRAGQGECGFFTTQDNWPIYYRKWIPPATQLTQKVVLCIHGFHSHGEKFVLLADHLFGRTWATYTIDLRGHGLSWKKLEDVGDIENYNLWIKDILEFIHFIGSQHPHLPLIIVAESMGAAASIHIASYKPTHLRSLIFLSPAFKAWKAVEFSMVLETLTFGLLGPATGHTIPVRSKSHFDTNNETYKLYELSDPLRLARATPRYNLQTLKMIHQVRTCNLDQFKPQSFYPTCVFYGGVDHLVDFEGDQEFIRCIHTKDKELHFIPDAAHELLSDRYAIDYGIYEKIIRWIERVRG
ncbi:MAG: acylglycerol lipase [Promethearchaeota archaeon CR_4]|nr:MAG: acylglycerol lipase [Candidatus Lokiarchaeota archaeon CR_4]